MQPTRRSVSVLSLAAVGLLLWGAPGIATANATADAAKAFIEDVANEALALATNDSLAPGEREDRFRALLRKAFDYERITGFTLGPYRRRATPEQLDTLAALLEDNVVVTYLRRFAEYEGQQFRILGAREGRNRSAEVITEVFTPGSDAEAFEARWILRAGDAGWKIVDVTLENIRMAVTYKDEFVDIITRNDGDIDALLNDLRQRNEDLRGQQSAFFRG